MVIELLAGGGLTVFGFALGRLPGRRRGPRPVEPECGCGHHHSFHDPKTGACHATDNLGFWGGEQHYEPCTCRRYSGPVPIPEMYAPELSGGES